MASSGSKALSGAASGAAAGSALGPWGMAAGAVIGGVGGLLSGDDPAAPTYQPAPPPTTPGGTSSQYGGMQIDPVTGRVIYTDNTSNGYGQASQYQNELMRQMLLGGNGAQIGLGDQIKTQQAELARLQAMLTPGAGGAKPIPSQFQGIQPYLDPATGDLAEFTRDPDGIKAGKYGEAGRKIYDEFMQSTQGSYGKGGFNAWLKDNINRNVQPQLTSYKKTQEVQGGNSQITQQAIQAAQQRLDNLLQIQKSGDQTQADFAKNPLMNYLNQRNMSPDKPDYMKQFADPNTQIMQDTFQKYLGKVDENVDSTAFKIAGATDPGMPDVAATNAKLMASLSGGAALGGERMAPVGDYDSKVGAFVNNLNRVAERNYASQAGLDAQNQARRGLMGGTSDISRLAMQQALEDNKAANAAQGYTMDANDRDKWFQQKFAVDAHNSDVTRLGSQAEAQRLQSILAQTSGNEFAAKQLYNQMQNQAWQNNQTYQNTNFNNAMTSLNQRTNLDQRTINNARTEEGLDNQNFQNRMNLLGYLQGADQQQWSQGIGNSQMGLSQQGLGYQATSGVSGNTNNWNAANTAGQNAQNMAGWQQQINDSAAQQQAFGQAMQGIGSAAGSQGWFDYSQPQQQQVGALNPNGTTTPTNPASNVPKTQTGTSGPIDFSLALAGPQTVPQQTPTYKPPAGSSGWLFSGASR